VDIPDHLKDFVLSLKGKGDAMLTIQDIVERPDCLELDVCAFVVHEGTGSRHTRKYHISYVPETRHLLLAYGWILEIPSAMFPIVEEAFENYKSAQEEHGCHAKVQGPFVALIAFRYVDAADVPYAAATLMLEGLTTVKNEWARGVEYLYKKVCYPGLGGGEKAH
jgi:hypothetical protein